MAARLSLLVAGALALAGCGAAVPGHWRAPAGQEVRAEPRAAPARATTARIGAARGGPRTLRPARAADLAAGSLRFAGTCRQLSVAQADLTGACAGEVVLRTDGAGLVEADLAIAAPPGRAGRLTLAGRYAATVEGEWDFFLVERVRFSPDAARLAGTPRGGEDVYLGGCSYTDPRSGRFSLICLAVSGSGPAVEARFESDAAPPR